MYVKSFHWQNISQVEECLIRLEDLYSSSNFVNFTGYLALAARKQIDLAHSLLKNVTISNSQYSLLSVSPLLSFSSIQLLLYHHYTQ